MLWVGCSIKFVTDFVCLNKLSDTYLSYLVSSTSGTSAWRLQWYISTTLILFINDLSISITLPFYLCTASLSLINSSSIFLLYFSIYLRWFYTLSSRICISYYLSFKYSSFFSISYYLERTSDSLLNSRSFCYRCYFAILTISSCFWE